MLRLKRLLSMGFGAVLLLSVWMTLSCVWPVHAAGWDATAGDQEEAGAPCCRGITERGNGRDNKPIDNKPGNHEASKDPNKQTVMARASDRELGLAYAERAAHGEEGAAEHALALLRRAESQSGGARGDAVLHAQLGLLEQEKGETDASVREYRRALAADENNALAAGNLARIEARRHHRRAAIRLWGRVFAHDPTQLAAGMNLAAMECAVGERDAARATLARMLEISPGDRAAWDFAEQIRSGNRRCESR